MADDLSELAEGFKSLAAALQDTLGNQADIVTVQQSGVKYLGAIVQALLSVFPRLASTFTLAAAASTAVANTGVIVGTIVVPFPANAAAATLQSGANAIYVASVTPGVGFTVTTASGAAAAGTEIFNYVATNPS